MRQQRLIERFYRLRISKINALFTGGRADRKDVNSGGSDTVRRDHNGVGGALTPVSGRTWHSPLRWRRYPYNATG